MVFTRVAQEQEQKQEQEQEQQDNQEQEQEQQEEQKPRGVKTGRVMQNTWYLHWFAK